MCRQCSGIAESSVVTIQDSEFLGERMLDKPERDRAPEKLL